MARSFFSLAMQVARASDRAQRAQQRAANQQARAKERAVRQQAAMNRRSYMGRRSSAVDEMNDELTADIAALDGLLLNGLRGPLHFNWKGLMRAVDQTRIEGEPSLQAAPSPLLESYLPKAPGIFGRLMPGWRHRYEQSVASARSKYEEAKLAFGIAHKARSVRLQQLQAEVNEHNAQVIAFREAYRGGVPEAVAGFFELVMEQCDYPEGFPSNWQVAYQPDSRQLIVDFDLPTMDNVVPTVDRFRYVKSSDTITEVKKSQKARQALYTSVVSQTVLRRISELFSADTDHVVAVIAINAFVDTIDPSTGRRIRPCLATVRTTREQYQQFDLAHVDPPACLRHLSAAVSRSPSELAAVKPIVDINMADPRFIQEADVLSTLDSRPNLMELSPSEFESLITNLFQKMGLETKLTQASRDGGVDCVAFDPRPILGGKVVVQAKRYKNTVGVSAVRDLFGTMHNEGASKGILVTTSGYGSAAYEFQKGKPIELLDGSNLLYLLKEHAGIDAKIIMPEDWRDPPSMS